VAKCQSANASFSYPLLMPFFAMREFRLSKNTLKKKKDFYADANQL